MSPPNGYADQSDHDLLVSLHVRMDEREVQRAAEREVMKGRLDNHGQRIGALEKFRNIVVGGGIVVGGIVSFFQDEIATFFKYLFGRAGHP